MITDPTEIIITGFDGKCWGLTEHDTVMNDLTLLLVLANELNKME